MEGQIAEAMVAATLSLVVKYVASATKKRENESLWSRVVLGSRDRNEEIWNGTKRRLQT